MDFGRGRGVVTLSFDVVVIGAGLSGLSFAYGMQMRALHKSLDCSVTLLDRSAHVGGLCRTDMVGEYLFDRTGHLLHFSRDGMRDWIEGFVRLSQHSRHASILVGEALVPYPFQNHLAYAPDAVLEDCLVGLCERANEQDEGSFLGLMNRTFGAGIVDWFLRPYNEKLTSVRLEDLSADWAGRFFPRADAREMVRGALSRTNASNTGYNSTFYYPERGIGSLCDGIAGELCDVVRLRTSCEVTSVDLAGRNVTLSDGEVLCYDALVSSMPLDELMSMCELLPDEIREAASRLKCASVLNVNVGLSVPAPAGLHWLYLPDSETQMYRIGFNSNFCSAAAPKGHSAVYSEVSYRAGTQAPESEQVLGDLLAVLRRLGMNCSLADVEASAVFDIPCAYVTYDGERAAAQATLLAFLESQDVQCIGRYGRWEYTSMEDAIHDGLSLSETLRLDEK